jgi:hypothetical protein
MGLFINKDKHPDVYKNNDRINESNQGSFKRNHLSELLEEQHTANEMLQHSFNELKDLFEKQGNKTANQWRYFGNRLYELKKGNQQHEKVESNMVEWLMKLDEKNSILQMTLENELKIKKDFIDRMNNLNHSNQEVVNRLDKFGLATDQLDLKVNEQLDLQKQMSFQGTKLEDKQNEVLKRMDSQEALTEKVSRQIDHFRSILFERTNYLAEKIDSGYNLTTLYFTKLMTGTDQSLNHFMIKQKLKENQKKTE